MNELAKSVAGKLGTDTAKATDEILAGTARASMGVNLADALVAGAFIVQCAQLAVQLWSANRDQAALRESLLARIAPHARLTEQSRKDIIENVCNQIAIKQ